jgi:hypothetical protein
VPGHEWPPSSYGLAAFDDAGTIVAHAGSGPANSIADCYALNVISDTAWACTYTDFPILACTPEGRSRWWSTSVSGSRGLAVERTYVLAAGGYAENGNRAVLVRLDDNHATQLGEWRLPFQAGYPDSVELIDGRGGDLHVVNNEFGTDGRCPTSSPR